MTKEQAKIELEQMSTKKSPPSTSISAYKSLDPVQMAEIYQKILWAIGQLTEATYEEIATSLKLPKEKIWKRMSELERFGKVYRPGNKRPLASKRLGYTWKLIESETIPEKVTEKSLPGKSVADYSRNILQTSLDLR